MKALQLVISSSLLAVASLATVGCQQPQAAPSRSAASAAPTLTSSPVAPPEPATHHGGPSQPHPHGPPSTPNGPRWHGGEEATRIYKFDFVLTPKDPKDANLTPTSFTLNIAENQTGTVTIGKNVPLQAATATPGAGALGGTMHASPRQDVGLKVNAHPRDLTGTEDLMLDVDLEMSSLDGTSFGAVGIRKLTSHGTAVVPLGKSALIMSVDDDKKHYELTVTTTKLK